jgi:hypothetical protein
VFGDMKVLPASEVHYCTASACGTEAGARGLAFIHQVHCFDVAFGIPAALAA